jgi:hypothetical protein
MRANPPGGDNMRLSIGRREIATGLTALLLLGGSAWAKRKVKRRDQLPTRAELEEVVDPGRLIYRNGLRIRRLAFESVIKQTMDRNYSQEMLDEVAKLFWTKNYKPVVLKNGNQMGIVEVQQQGTLGYGKRPPKLLDIEDTSNNGNGLDPKHPPLNPNGTEGQGNNGSGLDSRTPDSRMALARDLENGIHNEILRVLKEKGFNLVALNVFAQTMDLVKVILIVATQELEDDRIRPTLRDIRSIIENEVLAAKWPGVHLAELSSFTLLNERDNHFYEHPVLYWQLADPAWQGTGPLVPGRFEGEAPAEGGVATGPVQDYFSSNEFEPEEDFDERALLDGPIGGF